MATFQTLIEMLRSRAAEAPDARTFTFLVEGEAEEVPLALGQLDQRARALAVHLSRRSKPGDRAMLLFAVSPLEFIVAYFGAIYAGLVPVPEYPPDPARLEATLPRLRAVAADCSPTVVITTQRLAMMGPALVGVAPELAAAAWVSTDSAMEGSADEWKAPADVGSGSLCLLLYSSGSTGVPKGAMLTHGNVLHNAEQIRRCLATTETKAGRSASAPMSQVLWAPLSHAWGFASGVVQPIYASIPTYLMSPLAFAARPARWLEAVARYKATHTGGAPFAFDLCARTMSAEERAALDLSSLSFLGIGSEPIKWEVQERFIRAFAASGLKPEAFVSIYAMTEATFMISADVSGALPLRVHLDPAAFERNQIVVASEATPHALGFVGCGQVVSDLEVRIVNPTTSLACSADEVGEIWMRGKNVARGYWNRPEVTAQTFDAHLATGEGPYLRSGDLGFFREGQLFIAGRSKELIIIRGNNYYPRDIEVSVETALPSLPANSCAAFSADVGGQEALLIALEGTKETFEEIHPVIRAVVAQNHQLAVHSVLLVEPGKLPRTPLGKLQRNACAAGYLNRTLAPIATSILEGSTEDDGTGPVLEADPATLPAEEREAVILSYLLATCAKLLRKPLEGLDKTAAFNGLGLDSLMAVRLRATLSSALKRDIPATLVFNFPTPEAAARYLASTFDAPAEVAQKAAAPSPERPRAESTPTSEEEAAAKIAEKIAKRRRR